MKSPRSWLTSNQSRSADPGRFWRHGVSFRDCQSPARKGVGSQHKAIQASPRFALPRKFSITWPHQQWLIPDHPDRFRRSRRSQCRIALAQWIGSSLWIGRYGVAITNAVIVPSDNPRPLFVLARCVALGNLLGFSLYKRFDIFGKQGCSLSDKKG
jgi:hypothetical protein